MNHTNQEAVVTCSAILISQPACASRSMASNARDERSAYGLVTWHRLREFPFVPPRTRLTRFWDEINWVIYFRRPQWLSPLADPLGALAYPQGASTAMTVISVLARVQVLLRPRRSCAAQIVQVLPAAHADAPYLRTLAHAASRA